MKTIGVFAVFLFAIFTTSLVSARPAKSNSLSRQKRQSDQRLAELETLLALQKYGRHRLRMDRKKGAGAVGEHPPGYGIIDFRMLGRKKKSIRFSPGEFESSLNEEVSQDGPKIYEQQQEKHHLHPHSRQVDSTEESSSEELGNIYSNLPSDQVPISERETRPSLKANSYLYIERK